MLKRLFDVSLAAAGLVCLAPLLAIVAGLVWWSSPGPVFFRQERVGRGLRPFRIYKFRTMVVDAPARGAPLTHGDADPRITPVGRWLRRYKLDELPQLINVLVGDMSFVGPRPEVPRYVARFPAEFAELLQERPGITDPASLKYRDEGALLAGADDPEERYLRVILPDKLALSREYQRRRTLATDLTVICKTLCGGSS